MPSVGVVTNRADGQWLWFMKHFDQEIRGFYKVY